ncbi:phosphoadenylyl-sulfate reductase [Mesorhizobium plurifarium]|uniref:phosphoadenylyl-sulfate reductase n=1 Tax=Sinorhizobium arboris TaxID=76745 RepID=UPI0004109B37|nr:phosphoadenylyl-sulfate reductase [Sinorhizobium arboris]PST26396.1 phosphoadenylyl-sulfate reductase [Mesorhizobium plurifarium]
MTTQSLKAEVVALAAEVTDLEIEAKTLNAKLEGLDLAGRLALVAGLEGRAVFTTSLGIEDQVITAAIGSNHLDIEVATLKTGRLFNETVALIDRTEEAFGILIKRYYPEKADIDAYVAQYGMNGFYESVEARHACCGVRKLKPLARALDGASYWITGLRRGQSGNRAATPFAEADAERGLIKINPLADWGIETIQAHVAAEGIPVNPLHSRGYPSIGCEPCTRAIKPGEPERAGRWWWENDEKRECGLHVPEAASSIIPSASSAA